MYKRQLPSSCRILLDEMPYVIEVECVEALQRTPKTTRDSNRKTAHQLYRVPMKKARFNILIKIITFLKNTDILIFVLSVFTAVNCGSQFETNIPHDFIGTLFLFRWNFLSPFHITVSQLLQIRTRRIYDLSSGIICDFWRNHHISKLPTRKFA